MTHKRKRIRDAIVDVLNATTGFSGRVFANRARPTETAELPVVLVYTVNEDSELATTGYGLDRTLSVALELRGQASVNLDDALDDLCELAEAAINGDPTLGGLALVAHLVSTVVGVDGEGESRQALATLTYQVRYWTDRSGA